MTAVKHVSSHAQRRRASGQILPFRQHKQVQAPRAWTPGFAALMVAAPLATFSAVFLWDGPTAAFSAPLSFVSAPVQNAGLNIGTCQGSARYTCVVDGDTFWLHGENIRIADINTPEISDAGCGAERAKGQEAKLRLVELLNAGSFGLETVDRDQDQYGRSLRVVTRNGASLGDQLVAEGLAEPWRGRRSDWCRMLAAQ